MIRVLLILSVALFLGACASPHAPRGYDADTTPGRDGSEWIGGE